MKICSLFMALLAIASISPSATQAEHTPALYELAKRYEATVEAFEKTVRGLRGIYPTDVKLVDRLDDASARFRLAAKNPRQLNRLFFRWKEVQKLHSEVEQRIFSKYTPHHDLVVGWDRVNFQYVIFAEEFLYHVENPAHVKEVRRVTTSNARRDQFLRSFAPPASLTQ